MSVQDKHNIIVICGRKGVGKDKITEYITSQLKTEFVILRFADKIKDSLHDLFGWDRKKLDGLTPEDREWREQADPYWTKKLGWEVTPRNMMEYYGTDVMRAKFGDDFWVDVIHKTITDHLNRKDPKEKPQTEVSIKLNIVFFLTVHRKTIK